MNEIKNYNRRKFLKSAVLGTAALSVPWYLRADETTASSLVLVRGGTSAEALEAALAELGGISRFSPKGKKVVVKPNIGWDRTPAQGANTDPELVAAAVRTFVDADAKVHIFDFTCNAARRCYRRSGIGQAAEEAGAKVSFVHEKRFNSVELPGGMVLKKWPIYRDYLNADLRINMPVLKHHSLAGVSMGLKNLMGVMGEPRSTIHKQFDQKLIDIVSPILPELTILDARRVLRRNGPQGGNPDDVEIMNTVIVGFDPVAVDAEGARLFGSDPLSLGYLVEAENRGLGKIQRPADFREITIG
ncbi:cytoplasmic protein [candidate division LCP-89 bacterium B3_LCP]|uniref:Cytoplasmic protein n=1 Tax=candidate division LCP-89 bacterium B3_LCP TaxID=2012998 RepID=A0A532V3N2_UNCL8|nr:MAG: cytoplasmic protein [candidate division LCP-89 bacterium B3_LCP]